MDLDDLDTLIDALAGEDPARFADGESLVALHRHLARLDALVTAATARFDASRDWAADGARSAAAWTTTRCRIPSGIGEPPDRSVPRPVSRREEQALGFRPAAPG